MKGPPMSDRQRLQIVALLAAQEGRCEERQRALQRPCCTPCHAPTPVEEPPSMPIEPVVVDYLTAH